MFKQAPNYFYKVKPAKLYGKTQTTYQWETITPPENVPSNLKKHLKELKTYKAVEHNFQQDINAQIYYTPEEIEKFSIKLDPSNLQYQQADLKSFNATDLRTAAKQLTQQAITQAATTETDKQIKALQQQINQLKNQKTNTTTTPTTKGENNK